MNGLLVWPIVWPISAALPGSAGPVKTHVARILTKLSIRDRVQAVVVAYETGFVTRNPGG